MISNFVGFWYRVVIETKEAGAMADRGPCAHDDPLNIVQNSMHEHELRALGERHQRFCIPDRNFGNAAERATIFAIYRAHNAGPRRASTNLHDAIL